MGMLNRGPFNGFLYKNSVRSRGEMWQTTISVIKDKPLFGIGLDSLGDYSLMYQSEKTANGVAEYMDNAHNFFLQFASTGGLLLGLAYFVIIILSLCGFCLIQKRLGGFDKHLTAIMAGWVSFQLQSLISPAAIPTLTWNFIFCGALIGLSNLESSDLVLSRNFGKKDSAHKLISTKSLSSIVSIIVLVFTYPLFNADYRAKEANTKKDAILAVSAAKAYPESVVRYNLLGADLYRSGLYDLSLEIGRNAVKFNPNSYQTWILILVNPNASMDERTEAKQKLIRLDPFNKEIAGYKID
jgi:hypothetical protein